MENIKAKRDSFVALNGVGLNGIALNLRLPLVSPKASVSYFS